MQAIGFPCRYPSVSSTSSEEKIFRLLRNIIIAVSVKCDPARRARDVATVIIRRLFLLCGARVEKSSYDSDVNVGCLICRDGERLRAHLQALPHAILHINNVIPRLHRGAITAGIIRDQSRNLLLSVSGENDQRVFRVRTGSNCPSRHFIAGVYPSQEHNPQVAFEPSRRRGAIRYTAGNRQRNEADKEYRL